MPAPPPARGGLSTTLWLRAGGRWRCSQDDVRRAARVQRRVLDSAAAAVRPGGALVYATCSVFTAENEDAVEAFLERQPQFELSPFPSPLDGSHQPGTLQLWPDEHPCTAVFVARFRRV